MANTKEQQLQAFARRAARVSKALWPTNVRRSLATNRTAQTRRQLIVKSRYGRWSALFPTNYLKRGRPQGSPPFIHSTPAPTMNVVVVFTLTGACIVIMLLAHLWILCLLSVVALAGIRLLLVMVRTRQLEAKRSIHSVLLQGAERRSFSGVLSKTRSPNTPMPLDPPLVRVLETFDLSQTNVEHFLDLPEGGNTGGYSLENWQEAQTSLPKSVRK